MKRIVIFTLLLLLLSSCSYDDTIVLSDLHDVDIDLTQLSSVMVYSEVFQMVTNPKLYEGLVVRLEGQYLSYNVPNSDIVYHFILIVDALACCEEGLEFILVEGDYPEELATFTIQGVFASYEEHGQTFYHIKDSLLID